MYVVRLLVASVIFTFLATAAGAAPLAHMVFFTLSEDTDANRERLVAACKELSRTTRGRSTSRWGSSPRSSSGT